MYQLTMFKGESIIISKDQYQAVMDDSSTGKPGIMINNEYVAFKNIANITEQEMPTEQVKALPQAVEKSPNADLWIECLQKNKKLLLDGKMPKYIVEDGKIIEKENFWHDREEPETPKAYWVKKEVPLKQWISHYSQSPGYHLLENNGDQVEMAFTTLDPKNYQKLDVHEVHPSW